MNRKALIDTAIIVPARNEEDRIAACLAALSRQPLDRARVIVVVNNSDDRTAAIARRAGIAADVIECVLPTGSGVGLARRIGVEHALDQLPELAHILTTDADSRVAADWLDQTLLHLAEVDVVCGQPVPLDDNVQALSGIDAGFAELEGTYRSLVLAFHARHAPDALNHMSHHGEASGASLAFRRPAYDLIGGFADIKTGEDRDIVRRAKAAGLRVRHASDVRVRVSCRLDGRAPDGMAAALQARSAGPVYCIDSALPPARWLAEHSRQLPVWPFDGTDWKPLKVNELETQIAELSRLLAQPPASPILLSADQIQAREPNLVAPAIRASPPSARSPAPNPSNTDV